MTRFGRFIILALIGFALGAGLAYYQHTRDAAVTTSDVVAGAPEMPAAAADATAPVAGSTVGGAFSLTDHNGVAVTDTSYPGKLKLVFFGFANCPDICPTTLDKIGAALTTLGTQAGQIQPLFITTDPARDTADALKTYLSNYNASIVGLTGTEEQIKSVEEAYKVYVAPAADGSMSMDHSAYVYLMAENNTLLETFSQDDTADMMAEKIKPHLTEGTPAADVAPVAATDGATTTDVPVTAAPAEEATTGSSDAATPSVESSTPPPTDDSAATPSPESTDTSAPPAAQ